MTAATAKYSGNIKKKRTDPTRLRRPDPTPPSRDLRPHRRRFIDDYDEDNDLEESEARDSRKLKLVLKLPPPTADRHVSRPSTSSSSSSATSASDDDDDDVKLLKKRRIGRGQDSDGSGRRMERKRRNVVQRPIRAVSGIGTPLPERRVLEPILDKLQKRDTYGVFAEPVDPNELPDYHDVIEHPMDFGTVRRKLTSGRYRLFQQFEDDVFLICSNAMQYNAPDTIYFRQAHSIQEMARKNFQEIRAGRIFSESERKSEEKIVLASTEKKVRKLHGGTTLIPLSTEISLREKAPMQPQYRNALGSPGFGISSSEKKTVKKPQFRTELPQLGSDIVYREMKMLKKPQYRTTPEPLGSDISSIEKKMVKRPQYRAEHKPSRSDVSTMEKKALQKPQYTDAHETASSNISSMEKKTLQKPQYKAAHEPPRSVVSSMEKKMKKKPQHRATDERPGSDMFSKEKKTLRKPQYRTLLEPLSSDISSMEKITVKKSLTRSEPEPLDSNTSSQEKRKVRKLQDVNLPESLSSDISSMENITVKKSLIRCEPEPLGSNTSSQEKKTLRKPQNVNLPESLSSDVSSMENITVKKPLCSSEPEPLGSNSSSQEKDQNEHRSRTAPKPLGSDISFDATLVSASDTFAGIFSKAPADGDASATKPSISLNTEEACATLLTEDTCAGLNTVQASDAERSGTINDSMDGSSSLDECNLEKTEEVPAKCSSSKIDLKSFVVDVKRRETYNTLDQQPQVEADLELDVFDDEPKQLVTVGLHSEHAYARSLSRFAATLGPITWDVASKKLEQALPSGVKFGAGWVGEYEPLPTPVLSLAKNTQKQPTLTRKDKKIEMKSEANSRGSRNVKANRIMPEVSKSGQCKDMPFGLRSQMTTGIPPNITFSNVNEGRGPSNIAFNNVNERRIPPDVAFNDVNEGRIRNTREQKPELFGVNHMTMQKQNNQPAINFIKSYANETAPNATLSAAGANERNQATGNLAKVYTNETAVNYMGTIQVQSELPKQPEAVTAQRRNDGLGTMTGSLNNWRSCDNNTVRPNTPFGIISNHPGGPGSCDQNNARPNTPFGITSNHPGDLGFITNHQGHPGIIANHHGGSQNWLPRGSQEQANNDPLRWMSSSVKISDQPNTLNTCSNNLQQSMATVPIPKRENPNASAAAAQAWMSVGASPRWISVENGVPNKQVGSAPFRSNPPSRINEVSKIKPEPVYGVSNNSQSQAKGLVIFPQLMTTDVPRLQSPWQNRQKDTLPPDLNISFQPLESPARSSSGVFIDSQQPDLALQL